MKAVSTRFPSLAGAIFAMALPSSVLAQQTDDAPATIPSALDASAPVQTDIPPLPAKPRDDLGTATDGVIEQAPQAPRASTAIRVAMTDLDNSGVDERVAKLVTESVLAELRKLRGVVVISMDEIRAMLEMEAERQAMGCEEDASCLAEIAGALGADTLVVGSLARVGDEHVLGLKRINQREAAVEASVNKRLVAANGEEFLVAVGPAIAELFPDAPLRDGLTRGVPEEVALRLNPPPLPSWAFYSALTATGAVAALAVASVAVAGGLTTEWALFVWSGSVAPVDGAVLNQKTTMANVSLVTTVLVLGAATAVGIGTGLMVPFTDFQGYSDAEGD